jgi:uncharacterized LabA/DUF88 family protein
MVAAIRHADPRQVPLPQLRRLMIFIDGENMVCRYQEMIKHGRKPRDRAVLHKVDTYIWSPDTWVPRFHIVVRATYYTYVKGDNLKVEAVSEELRQMKFDQFSVAGQPSMVFSPDRLYPSVFKKSKGAKAKGVDIKMTVDILTHAYQDNLDSILLISGDGDYKPVIEECIRRGKQVYIAAFSSGLSEGLKLIADEFVCLDDIYFEKDG